MKTYQQDLNSLKYNELQKLAKSVGIRANQKIEKLIKALTVHYNESESRDKNASDTGNNRVSEKIKIETGVRSHFSNSHVKSSPLFKTQDEGLETPNHTGGRKRRRTFELDEASFHENTPTIETDISPENVSKRQRRSTFDKIPTSSSTSDEKSSTSTSSPSTKAIIEAMDANLSSSERRRRLLSALTRKVQTTVASSSSAKSSQPSLIPRFTTFVVNRKKEDQKSLTPGNKDWKKIHKKEFSKFDSIDVYLEKKKQRKDQLSNSSKKSLPFGSPSAKTRPAITKPVNKNPRSAKIFQPQVTSVQKIDFNFTKMSSCNKKTPAKHLSNPSKSNTPTPASKANISNIVAVDKERFQPQVTSVREINFNFNKMTSCNKKTPARRPSIPGKGGTPTPASKASLCANVYNKVAGGTPFKFTGNTSSAKKTAPSKTAFDLKASLARPLTWKPHTGKLQPLDFNKEQTVQTQRLKTRGPVSHRILANKTRSAKVKTEQRAKAVDRRTNQKYMDMMKKRGLLA